MQELFLAYIKEKALFSAEDKVVLAVSGGLDSVAMVHLFSQSPYRFAIAHVNFGLRGEESEADARFVEALAEQLGVPFYSSRQPAAEWAMKQKVSIQMAARELRYQWFETLCQQESYAYVATAHHLNDQAETQLLNLCRGTGLAGLRGIAPKRGVLVRPLLWATRLQLEAYAKQQLLSWREDSSNSSLKYRRNKIRQRVMPVLKELNPSLEHTLQEVAERLGAAESLIKHWVEVLRNQVLSTVGQHHYLQLPPLLRQAEPRYLLAELLAPYGAGWAEAGVLLQTLQGADYPATGKWVATATHRINLDREQLVISPLAIESTLPLLLHDTDQEINLGFCRLQTRKLPAQHYPIPSDAAVAALDLAKLQFPLQLRHPQPGDWFIPLGMRGKKKLSDFMIDRKIPVNLKAEVLLVLSGEAVAWVAGYRPDNRFKLTADTEEIFEIRLLKP